MIAAGINAAMYIILAFTLSNLIGFAGIATANTIAFTIEALLLLYLLNRKYPGILRSAKTIARIMAGCVVTSGLLYLYMQLPFNSLILSISGMALGALINIPIIWPEIRLLLSIGEKHQAVEQKEKTGQIDISAFLCFFHSNQRVCLDDEILATETYDLPAISG